MLPFLKPKQMGAVTTTYRKPDGQTETQEEGQPNEGLNVAAAELIRAVHAKDEAAVVTALRSAFQMLDSEPHEEGPHTNEESE